jgi:hypothetical protein
VKISEKYIGKADLEKEQAAIYAALNCVERGCSMVVGDIYVEVKVDAYMAWQSHANGKWKNVGIALSVWLPEAGRRSIKRVKAKNGEIDLGSAISKLIDLQRLVDSDKAKQAIRKAEEQVEASRAQQFRIQAESIGLNMGGFDGVCEWWESDSKLGHVYGKINKALSIEQAAQVAALINNQFGAE